MTLGFVSAILADRSLEAALRQARRVPTQFMPVDR